METPITFITGNQNKFLEAAAILPGLIQKDLDLEEIQSADSREIIEHKLTGARAQCAGPIICEDISLSFDGLNGLPGPLIKWFLKSLGPAGLYKLASAFGNQKAIATATIGYSDGAGEAHFFEGSISGMVVEPRGDTTFGWDPIFQPDGFATTFAEMTKEEKNGISHRTKALAELKKFLKV